jgi:hypothetical protein
MEQTSKEFIETAINESLKRRVINRDLNKSKALQKLLDLHEDIKRKIKELEK